MFKDVRFPTDISLGSSGGPERRTQIVRLSGGRERRNTSQADSLRRYNAGYGIKSLDDIHKVLAFFESVRGRLYSFRWKDHRDFKSSLPSTSISSSDQAVSRIDDRNFQLVKTYQFTGAPDPYVRYITKPILSTLSVELNGVVQTKDTDYIIHPLTGIVEFKTTQFTGAVIKAGFEFDVPARFDSDFLDISLEAIEAGSIPNIPIIEVLE